MRVAAILRACVRKFREAAHFLSEMFRKFAEMIQNEQGKKGKGRERGERRGGGKNY